MNRKNGTISILVNELSKKEMNENYLLVLSTEGQWTIVVTSSCLVCLL